MINRRQFLFGFGALGLGAMGALNTLPFSSVGSKQKQWLASGASDNKGNFFLAAFDLSGNLLTKVPLPARAHEILPINSKPGHVLVVARRPGQYILEVNLKTGDIVDNISVAASNRFYGHARLIENDNVLLTTENDYQRGKGLVVLRDRKSQKVLEQYDSGGIGPHQIAIMPNSNENQIVIANGGILTHPDHGRKKLNLNTMQPNLSYLTLADGKVQDSFQLDNHHLSIRHLDVSHAGKVVAGLQYQGASTDEVPLAVSHQGESQLQFLKADMTTWRSMKNYTASVCIHNTTNLVAITSPQAGKLTLWDLTTDEFITSHKLKDVAGIAVSETDIIASTGRGRTVSQKGSDKPYQIIKDFDDIRWDNHMCSVVSV